jgi:hypothetical protein
MSEPIKVGDLVVVVRSAAHNPNCGLGHVFTVTAIRERAGRQPSGKYKARCSFCGWKGTRGQGAACLVADGSQIANGIPLGRLKRIPPLGDLESQHTQEDIREPA